MATHTLTIDYGFTTRSYPITQIMFQAEDGTSVASYTPNGYVVDGLTVPHTITLTQVQPQVEQPPIQPQVQQPTTKPPPKTKHKGGLTPGRGRGMPPEPMKVGQTGRIWGLGTRYDDEGNAVRPSGTYRFTVTRVLRNGSNVIITMEDGRPLTLRWRTHSMTTGRGWTVRTKDGTFYQVDVQLD